MPAQFRVGKIEGARHKRESAIQERRLCVSWLRRDEWDEPAAHEPGVTGCKFTLSEEYEQRNESAAGRVAWMQAGGGVAIAAEQIRRDGRAAFSSGSPCRPSSNSGHPRAERVNDFDTPSFGI